VSLAWAMHWQSRVVLSILRGQRGWHTIVGVVTRMYCRSCGLVGIDLASDWSAGGVDAMVPPDGQWPGLDVDPWRCCRLNVQMVAVCWIRCWPVLDRGNRRWQHTTVLGWRCGQPGVDFTMKLAGRNRRRDGTGERRWIPRPKEESIGSGHWRQLLCRGVDHPKSVLSAVAADNGAAVALI
jgi:hypothetical protein